MTNRGFVELHNATGFYLVGIGFLLVMLIVAAGGIFAMMIEREQVERRRQMRLSQMSEAVVDVSRATDDSVSESEEPAERERDAHIETEPTAEGEQETHHPHEPS